jgi:hypothetical protein
LDDVLNKSEAALSTQHQFSHKSHDPGTRVLCMVKVNALSLCGLKLHGHYWHQQIKSQFPPSIQVQQVSAGPGPYPQVVLLQTEPEPFTHQSTSHLDSSQIFSTHIPMPKDNPVVLSSSIDHGATQISSGNNPYHGCEATARPYARLTPHPLACPELHSYHVHIDVPLHQTHWVAEQCALCTAHRLANDMPADTTTEALALCKSSILLPAVDSRPCTK